MAKSAGALGIVFTACLLGWSAPAQGQRIIAPGRIPTNTAPSLLPGPAGVPGAVAPPSYGYGVPTIGATPPPPATYTYPPGSSPAYSPYGAAPISPLQPGAPTLDPYATPGGGNPTVFSSDPNWSSWGGSTDLSCYWESAKERFVEVTFDYTWMPGNGPDELGLHDADLAASFGIPFLYDPNAKLYVTPGLAVQWWNGPPSTFGDPTSPDMPARTYEAYLDGAWNPQMPQIPQISGELGFRVGVYSDFGRVDADSLRYQGSGLAVIGLSNSYQLKFGVIYLDRLRIKLLPAGGIVWTPPGGDINFQLLFPNPKLAWRLRSQGAVQTWAYLRGEYGGGSWDVQRHPEMGGGTREEVDYNDIRVAVGFEFENPNAVAGQLEIGVAFERELHYRTSRPDFNPNATVLVGGVLAF